MFVFLTGAGFSTAFGLPVMNQFRSAVEKLVPKEGGRSGRAGNEADDLRSHFERTLEFQKQCDAAKDVIVRDWNNMEELYTQAHLRQLLSKVADEKTHADALCNSIEWTIWKIYSEFNLGFVRDLVAIIQMTKSKGLVPAFVTTNYDLLIEWAWWSLDSDCRSANRLYYPGLQYWESADEYHCMHERDVTLIDSTSDVVDIPLAKLHGSASWFTFSDGSGGSGATKYVAASKFFDRSKFSLAQFRESVKAAYCLPELPSITPTIIPPMLGKVAIPTLLQRQWRATAECLKRAKYLAIIGYSFPPSDLFMTRLLTEGLQKNTSLQKIWVVDLKKGCLERKRWVSDVLARFSKDSRHLVELCHTGTASFFEKIGSA